jgi:hypothetical protein
MRMGRNGGAREGGRRSARLWLVSAHWGKALGKVKCPSGGSAMLRAGRDGLGRVEDGVAEVVNSAFVDAGVTVLLLLYGCCWLRPGTQICRTQGG